MPGHEVVLAVVRLEDGDVVTVAFVRDDGAVRAALVLCELVLPDVFEGADVLITVSAADPRKLRVGNWTVSRLASDFSSLRARTTKGLRAVAILGTLRDECQIWLVFRARPLETFSASRARSWQVSRQMLYVVRARAFARGEAVGNSDISAAQHYSAGRRRTANSYQATRPASSHHRCVAMSTTAMLPESFRGAMSAEGRLVFCIAPQSWGGVLLMKGRVPDGELSKHGMNSAFYGIRAASHQGTTLGSLVESMRCPSGIRDRYVVPGERATSGGSGTWQRPRPPRHRRHGLTEFGGASPGYRGHRTLHMPRRIGMARQRAKMRPPPGSTPTRPDCIPSRRSSGPASLPRRPPTTDRTDLPSAGATP